MRFPAWFKGTVLLTATLAAGILIGVAYERRQPARHDAISIDAHDALHRLSSDLALDGPQQQAVTEIFARHQKEIDSTWHAMQPHVRATMDATHQEVLAILRPEQAEKFKKLIGTMHTSGHR